MSATVAMAWTRFVSCTTSGEVTVSDAAPTRPSVSFPAYVRILRRKPKLSRKKSGSRLMPVPRSRTWSR